jgi:2-phospho-L-lactate guanylyltransferase
VILVPVKDLRDAKQRLAPALSPEQRVALARAMLEDVFEALAPFATDPGVTIVSGDMWASQRARARRFSIILDDAQAGETAAIEMATSYCVGNECEFSVVFPADIPLITSVEVSDFLALKPKKGVVISPASDGRGTNGILRTPPDLIPLRFGNDSFLPHLAAAKATGFDVIVHQFPGIAVDVDRPDDLEAVMSEPIRSRAQRLLAEWKIVSSVHA